MPNDPILVIFDGEPEPEELPEAWLNAGANKARSEADELISEVGRIAEEIAADVGALLEPYDAEEDRIDKSRLVRLDLAIEALYRFRNELLDVELPTWTELATGQIEQKWSNFQDTVEAGWAAATEGKWSELAVPLDRMLSFMSMRGLIHRTENALKKATKFLRSVALPQRRERRRAKNILARA